ncbi:hypothetical protein FACS1894139_09960 [Planctomycetales bacterium]|nr:hypothetical protein FACS1894107_01740 [Planctomycetales bacterium]GHT05688.1 hypothetical protein FACS1894139_09960 [Planctomycetales bacterium]GHV21083.1 hypothetical protein AGMMS49959_09600 [Planctomycetales bacterium]
MMPQNSWWRKVIRSVDLTTLLFSVVIGVLVWFYVSSRRTTTREISVPVEVALPDGWTLDGRAPAPRDLILHGSHQMVEQIVPGGVKFVAAIAAAEGIAAPVRDIDLHLTRDDLSGLTREVEVTAIKNADLHLRLVRQVRRYLPVELDFTGALPAGYALKSYNLSPQNLAVVAPMNYFTPDLVIKTQPVDLSNRTASFVTYTNALPLIINDRRFNFSDAIMAQVAVAETPSQKTLNNVPVAVLASVNGQVGGKISPAQVTVKIDGSEVALGLLGAGQITVFVDERDLRGNGAQKLKCRAIANDAYQVREITPAEVEWSPPESRQLLSPQNSGF